MKRKSRYITQAALIAAIYTVLTITVNAFNLANGIIQIRISEALTVLPFFTPAAVPGLFAGCLLGNVITGCLPWDIIFGSLATLLGAAGTYFVRRVKWLVPLPPVLANTLILPFVLQYAYGMEGGIWYFMVTVGAGEIISCGLLGMLLLTLLNKYRMEIFN